MKNNTPACILIDPEKYEEMIEHSKIMLYISRRKNECIIPKAVMEKLASAGKILRQAKSIHDLGYSINRIV
jgi:rRNA-processing protein FCF1